MRACSSLRRYKVWYKPVLQILVLLRTAVCTVSSCKLLKKSPQRVQHTQEHYWYSSCTLTIHVAQSRFLTGATVRPTHKRSCAATCYHFGCTRNPLLCKGKAHKAVISVALGDQMVYAAKSPVRPSAKACMYSFGPGRAADKRGTPVNAC